MTVGNGAKITLEKKRPRPRNGHGSSRARQTRRRATTEGARYMDQAQRKDGEERYCTSGQERVGRQEVWRRVPAAGAAGSSGYIYRDIERRSPNGGDSSKW